MVKLEDDERPFKEIWDDYLKVMAEASWSEISNEPLSLDVATVESATGQHSAGVWKILDHGTMVGYVTWLLNRHFFLDRMVCYIPSLYIKPEHRSPMLLRHVLNSVRLKMKGRAYYYVLSSNKQKSLCDRVWLREV